MKLIPALGIIVFVFILFFLVLFMFMLSMAMFFVFMFMFLMSVFFMLVFLKFIRFMFAFMFVFFVSFYFFGYLFFELLEEILLIRFFFHSHSLTRSTKFLLIPFPILLLHTILLYTHSITLSLFKIPWMSSLRQ